MNLDRWLGTTAVVTGASSGIGASICQKFLKAGINVVGLARRIELIEKLCEKYSTDDIKLHPLECDLSKEENILQAFSWIEENVGSISILVNNAGVLLSTSIIEGDSAMWKKTMDINFIGLSICTREAIKSMRKHNVDGQIIHISSIAGHFVPHTEVPVLNVYPSSKHAVAAATETLRRELNYNKLKIKITSISPGLVATDMAGAIGVDDPEDLPPSIPILKAEDVADACLYVLSTPPHVQIHDIMIRPLGEEI